MARLYTLYGFSIAAHVGLAVWVGSMEVQKHRETIAIEMSESKKPEPPKKADVPPPPPEPPKANPRPAAAAAKAAAPEPAPAAAPPSALDALPDFGLTLGGASGAGEGGLAVAVRAPAGGDAAPKAEARAPAPPPRVLGPKPVVDGCTEPVVKPKPQHISQPSYTSAAREAAVEGKVRVEVSVDASGQVKGVRLLAGLGHGLDEAALEAARRATFQPATQCGQPVGATFVIAMRFSL